MQVGNNNLPVKKIMIGLDVAMPLLFEARKWGADLVITHHPLMMQPQNVIDFKTMPGSAIQLAAQENMGIISVHTNLDKTKDGLNDYFSSLLGLKDIKVFVADSVGPAMMNEERTTGIGRIGNLENPASLSQFVNIIKTRLKLPRLRVTGKMTLPVERVAVCTGSGGSLIDNFIASDADVYITGDLKYHDARLAEEHSKGLIDVGHFGSECMAVDLIADKLTLAAKTNKMNLSIKKYKNEKDPFNIV